jgi:hypothetical protein
MTLPKRGAVTEPARFRNVNMPIHFRCAFCNQLLGIARRKSGSVINCPTCGGPLVVPRMPEGEDKSDQEKPAENRLLEDCDIDVILRPPAPAQAVAASVLGTTPGSAAPGPTSPSHRSGGGTPSSSLTHSGNGAGGLVQARPAEQRSGLVISNLIAIFMAIALVLLLAGAFAGGFLLGRLTAE